MTVIKFQVGDYIKIIELNSSQQKKHRRPYKGEISFIDMQGFLYGTWGGFNIDPKIDKIEKI